MGALHGDGYGTVKDEGINKLTHREMFRIVNGHYPTKGFACHTCDVRPCINPYHLFDGDSTDNNKDRHNKGRSGAARGEHNGRAKITAAQADEIRSRYAAGGVRYVDLAAEYGLSFGAIGFIVRGAHWKGVTR